jgi:hypothetical protein
VPENTLLRVSGYRRGHRKRDDAHSFAQSRTRRINQFFGFDISTGSLDLAAPRQLQCPKHATNFHAFLRAIFDAQETSFD